MQSRSASVFVDSPTHLAQHEQKTMKTAGYGSQVNPACAGLRVHRVARCRKRVSRSVWGNRDIRMIDVKRRQGVVKGYGDCFATLPPFPAMSAERAARRNRCAVRFVTVILENLKKAEKVVG